MTPLSREDRIIHYHGKGYEVIAPGWPDIGERTPAEIRENPEPLANKSITDVVDHYEKIIRDLPEPPFIIGHSFAGLFTQILASRGLGRAAAAISPAQVCQQSISLASEFHYGFGNNLSESESAALYEKYAIPAVLRVLFQGALGGLSQSGPGYVDFDKADKRHSCSIPNGAEQWLARGVDLGLLGNTSAHRQKLNGHEVGEAFSIDGSKRGSSWGNPGFWLPLGYMAKWVKASHRNTMDVGNYLHSAVPAAAGVLAYANAKASIGYDLFMGKIIVQSLMAAAYRQRTQRLNLFSDLEYWATRPDHADVPILLYQGRTWTYKQMYETVLCYGHWLKTTFGIKPKQIVAMAYTTSDMFAITWLALWSIGATPAFINNLLTGKGLAHCLRISTATICLVDPDVASAIQEISGELPDMKFVVVTPEVQKSAFNGPSVRSSDELREVKDRADLAILIYTSGTTGFPKAAIVSWTKVIRLCVITQNMLGLRKGHTLFSAMPFYHSTGSLVGFASTLYSGSTLALSQKFSKNTFWKDIRDTNSNSILYIGEAMRYLLDAPTEYDPVTGENLDKKHNVKTIYGAGLRADVWAKFKERFGIDTVIEFYGATEGVTGTWNISSNSLSEGAVGRVGWLLESLVLKRQSIIVLVDWETDEPLRDASGACIKARPGETGELLLKVPTDDINSAFQGYYNNSEATEKKILRDVVQKGDAWFRTGDSLRWDGDGLLFFSDRLGDTFRWKGENVSTMEVGNVMGMHPCVAEANVYGVQLPHHDGRAGCAATSFRSGTPSSEELESLATHLRKCLPRYAVPLFLRRVDEVGNASTTTGTHKQQKVALRKAGVNPVDEKGEDVPLYWLKSGTYIPFGRYCEPSPTVAADSKVARTIPSALFDGSPDVLDLLRLGPVSISGLSGDGNIHMGPDMSLSISQRMASYVFELPSRVGYNAAPDTAISCVAAALRWRSSLRHFGAASSEDFLLLYGKALQAIQRSIEDTEQCIAAETLAATELLCMFEALVRETKRPSTQHAAGVYQLIQHRGTERFTTDFEKSLLAAYVSVILIDAYYGGRRLFLEEPEWQSVLQSCIVADPKVGDRVWANHVFHPFNTDGSLVREIKYGEQHNWGKMLEQLCIYEAFLVVFNRLHVALRGRNASDVEEQSQRIAKNMLGDGVKPDSKTADGVPRYSDKAVQDARFEESQSATGLPYFCQQDNAARASTLKQLHDTVTHNFYVRTLDAELLTSVTRHNTIRAMICNASYFSLTMDHLREDILSSFTIVGPVSYAETALPPSLRPTELQKRIPHHPWIDLCPIPSLRDALLIWAPIYDEDELCHDLFTGAGGHEESQIGMVVWGEAWDPAAYELSEAIMQKWQWLLRDCSDIISFTNSWRRKRQISPLQLD
ncbi:hypothetical protein PWT90_08046 [Aphanocladium album]|nr:hypothetical protein PWT90_08046 [Aphanocladium album]